LNCRSKYPEDAAADGEEEEETPDEDLTEKDAWMWLESEE
jgi:hypothetical protein